VIGKTINHFINVNERNCTKMEEQPGIMQARRFITFYRLRKALGLVRAANKQFTDRLPAFAMPSISS
jgi:hypothetical protein